MGFLTPILLALGAAVAVPLVLHLLQRQHGPRVEFPALRYLRRAEKENAHRIRLRQLLLLALRVGAIVLLAAAAARPFLSAGGAEHKPTATVIILDNSLSSGTVTGDRRVLDLLQERALETLALAGPDDRFWLVRAATPWQAAVPGDADATARRVRETRAVAGSADLTAALDRARALLEAGAEGRSSEIHLLSDLQATGLAGTLDGADEAGPPVIAWMPPEETLPSNRGIDAVQVGGGLPPLANARSTVTASIAGPEDGDSTTVRLVVDGQVSGAAVAPTGSEAVLPFPARSGGLVTGWVEIDPDALRGDDRRYFATRVRRPPRVALTRPARFVDEGLSVLADADRIRRVDPGAAEVVVAPGTAGFDTGDDRTLVALAPSRPVELPAANRRLAAAGIPWRFAIDERSGAARFDLDDQTDPALEPLGDIRLRHAYRLEREGAEPDDSVLMRLRDGTPWAVRGTRPGGGRYVIAASPLSSDESGALPTSPAMLPLLDRLVGQWAAERPDRLATAPGEVVPLPPEATVVERPDGGRDTLRRDLPYRAPAEPGLYRVRTGDDLLTAFAVNPPASESDLRRASSERLRAALPGWPVELVRRADAWPDRIYHDRFGREIWRPILLIALAVLLIEGLVAAAGGVRSDADRAGSGPRSESSPSPKTRVAAAGRSGGRGQ